MKRVMCVISFSLLTVLLVMGHAPTGNCADRSYGPRAIYSPFQEGRDGASSSRYEMNPFAFGIQDTVEEEKPVIKVHPFKPLAYTGAPLVDVGGVKDRFDCAIGVIQGYGKLLGTVTVSNVDHVVQAAHVQDFPPDAAHITIGVELRCVVLDPIDLDDRHRLVAVLGGDLAKRIGG